MSVTVRSYLGAGDETSLGEDVLDGLTRPFKELPPKHFYDRAGAELFDRICDLPEYYPTRAERAILVERSGDVAALTGAAEVVELGSGTAAKSRLLLSALAQAGTLRRYLPVDVTEGMIRATGDEREELRTEISAKFTPDRLEADLAAARLEPVELFTDADTLFGLTLARPLPAPRFRAARDRGLAFAA